MMPRSRPILALAIALSAGCSWDLPSFGGVGYQLNTDRIGTGQPAITPRNDHQFWDGEAMDNRRGK